MTNNEVLFADCGRLFRQYKKVLLDDKHDISDPVTGENPYRAFKQISQLHPNSSPRIDYLCYEPGFIPGQSSDEDADGTISYTASYDPGLDINLVGLFRKDIRGKEYIRFDSQITQPDLINTYKGVFPTFNIDRQGIARAMGLYYHLLPDRFYVEGVWFELFDEAIEKFRDRIQPIGIDLTTIFQQPENEDIDFLGLIAIPPRPGHLEIISSYLESIKRGQLLLEPMSCWWNKDGLAACNTIPPSDLESYI